jgi:hypothetical protein
MQIPPKPPLRKLFRPDSSAHILKWENLRHKERKPIGSKIRSPSHHSRFGAGLATVFGWMLSEEDMEGILAVVSAADMASEYRERQQLEG